MAGAGGAAAQVRYDAAQLDCAAFAYVQRSDILTGLAGRERREGVDVAGLWALRARPAPGDTIRVEAWFDSLAVRRSTPEGTLAPDTDGIIGGRYRGVLTADGGYTELARPFVPDGVGEVIDLSRAAADLLPRLPPAPLAVGAAWGDGHGLEIRRLPDSVAADTLLRFAVTVTRTADSVTVRGDTAPASARQSTREEERFVWHRREGLVRRDRRLVIETVIPPGGRLRHPVQSRVEQRIVVERPAAFDRPPTGDCRPSSRDPAR
ncbi:MAG TPA: hypothetical protein VFU46_03815 [Gemmatimonadales bacterium]|nr:hypothetical protein [Gemmatimonadales bacterium]